MPNPLDKMRHRFLRLERMLGSEALDRLEAATVAIVGLGAVGGYALEGLARAGVGHFRLYDHDRIGETNINRQLLALDSTIGKPKVEVALARVRDINPSCEVSGRCLFVHEDSLHEVLEPRPDLLIDAIDSMNPKLALLTGTYRFEVPVISSMGAALRQDPGAVRTGDLMDSEVCPLAKRMRKVLRRRGVGRGIQCVYSVEPVEFDYRDPDEEDHVEDPQFQRGRPRRVLGSLATITGIFGLTIANLAIQSLTQKNACLTKPTQD